jgi:hypothetical protein
MYSACIHASAPNLSTAIRHAITITVLLKNFQLVYNFRNSELGKDLIEKHYVTEEFYYRYDFISEPDETLWHKEVMPYKHFDLNGKQIISLISAYH